MGKYLNKPLNRLPESGSSPLLLTGEWPILLPALVEFLTLSTWEDGTPRLPGSLTLFVDQGLWKLCLSDKDSGRVAFVSGSSAEEAFQSAESAIVHSTMDWRGERRNGARKKER